MTTPTWKMATDPVAATAEATALEHEDKLLAELADVSFAQNAGPVATPAITTSAAVPPQAVHAVEADYQAVHAALQAGTIPTFADEPGTTPAVLAVPVDAAAEREAYITFVQFMRQHGNPATTLTALDPDDYIQGLI
jgi:hypothetical protein